MTTGSKGKAMDDGDLEDLLGSNNKGSKIGLDEAERMPLNLDHLSKGQLDLPHQGRAGRAAGSGGMASIGLMSFIFFQISYCCERNPKACTCLLIGLIVFVSFFIIASILNPTERFGIIKHDFSDQESIPSKYEISAGFIDHWCLQGGNDNCRCDDPLQPLSRMEFKSWSKAHLNNRNRVTAYRESDYIDVAFLGESLVEEMDGTWMGRQQGPELMAIKDFFEKNFKRENNGMDGVALGIAGDTSPNVLWRLQHGEMPDDFNPRVWWLSLGMNDLARMQCSEEVVVLGILRVVEEIQNRKPDAKIVINSILPMADLRGGVFPRAMDYKDAFRNYKGLPKIEGGPALEEKEKKAIVSNIIKNNPNLAIKEMEKRYKRPETTTIALHKTHAKDVVKSMASNNAAATPTKKDEDKSKEDPKKEDKPKEETKKEEPKKEETKEDKSKEETKEDKSKEETKEEKSKEKTKEASDDTNKKRRVLGGKKDKHHNHADDGDAGTERSEKEKEKKSKEEMEKLIKQIKKDPVDPRLNLDRTKIKKRDPKTLFMTHNRLPIWTSIEAINKELKKFCEKNEKVTFYDATQHFATRDSNKKLVLKSERISIRGHPTEMGFAVWENAVAAKLKSMFEEEDKAFAANEDPKN